MSAVNKSTLPGFIFLSGILLACGGNGTTDENSANNSGTNSINDEKLVEKTNDYEVDLFKDYFDQQKKKYKKILYGVPLDTTAYFIYADKEPDYNYSDGNFNKSNVKLGMIDYKGREILEKKYKKIANPGVFGKGLIEVQGTNRKYGLFDLSSGKELVSEYELIFPVSISDENKAIIAYARKGKKYVGIDEDFNEVEIKIEDYSKELLKARGQLDVLKYSNYYYITGNDIDYDAFSLTPSEDGFLDIFGVFFIPNYYLNFYTDQEIFSDLAYGGSDWGRTAASGIVEKEEKNNSFTTFILNFFEQGTDARGYTNETKYVVTTDKNSNVLSKKTLFTDYNYANGICGFNGAYKYIDKNTIEVKITDYNQEYEIYRQSPKYTYYRIEKNGDITDITPKGAFPFTSMVKISNAYFKCCLEQYLEDEDRPTSISEDFNTISFQHYSIDDLEIMRAEILARYGFKFGEEPELYTYFKRKSWYNPTNDDVSGMLSEIESHNINLILDQIQKMKGNEEKYTKPEYGTFYAAG